MQPHYNAIFPNNFTHNFISDNLIPNQNSNNSNTYPFINNIDNRNNINYSAIDLNQYNTNRIVSSELKEDIKNNKNNDNSKRKKNQKGKNKKNNKINNFSNSENNEENKLEEIDHKIKKSLKYLYLKKTIKNSGFHYLNIFLKQKLVIINVTTANVRLEEKYNLIMKIY